MTFCEIKIEQFSNILRKAKLNCNCYLSKKIVIIIIIFTFYTTNLRGSYYKDFCF